MGENLSYRRSGKGYTELVTAFGSVKKWAEEQSLAHESRELKFSVSATLANPAEKQERLFDASETDHTQNNGKKQRPPSIVVKGWRCKRCKSGHHDECTKGDCTCTKCLPEPTQEETIL